MIAVLLQLNAYMALILLLLTVFTAPLLRILKLLYIYRRRFEILSLLRKLIRKSYIRNEVIESSTRVSSFFRLLF